MIHSNTLTGLFNLLDKRSETPSSAVSPETMRLACHRPRFTTFTRRELFLSGAISVHILHYQRQKTSHKPQRGKTLRRVAQQATARKNEGPLGHLTAPRDRGRCKNPRPDVAVGRMQPCSSQHTTAPTPTVRTRHLTTIVGLYMRLRRRMGRDRPRTFGRQASASATVTVACATTSIHTFGNQTTSGVGAECTTRHPHYVDKNKKNQPRTTSSSMERQYSHNRDRLNLQTTWRSQTGP